MRVWAYVLSPACTFVCLHTSTHTHIHVHYIHTTLESDWSREDKARFEELCEQKIKIVEERNEIVMQTEEERKR